VAGGGRAGRGTCRGRKAGQQEGHRVVSGPGAVLVGTRGSPMARWQAGEIGRLLRAAHPGLEVSEKIVVTAGDRQQTGPVIDLGGKGVWVKEIEEGLLAGEIDVAVHSMKDVPAQLAPGLAIVAVPTRADPRDAIVSRGGRLVAGVPGGLPPRQV